MSIQVQIRSLVAALDSVHGRDAVRRELRAYLDAEQPAAMASTAQRRGVLGLSAVALAAAASARGGGRVQSIAVAISALERHGIQPSPRVRAALEAALTEREADAARPEPPEAGRELVRRWESVVGRSVRDLAEAVAAATEANAGTVRQQLHRWTRGQHAPADFAGAVRRVVDAEAQAAEAEARRAVAAVERDRAEADAARAAAEAARRPAQGGPTFADLLAMPSPQRSEGVPEVPPLGAGNDRAVEHD